MSFIETILWGILGCLIIPCLCILIALIIYCCVMKAASDKREIRIANNAFQSHAGQDIRQVYEAELRGAGLDASHSAYSDAQTDSPGSNSVQHRSNNHFHVMQTMLALLFIITLASCAENAIHVQTNSYQSCGDGLSVTPITCSSTGLYTRMEFTYVRDVNATSLLHDEASWLVVASNTSANDRTNLLSSLQQCIGTNLQSATCTEISNEVTVSVRTLGVKSVQHLMPSAFETPYGYYFDTLNSTADFVLRNASEFADASTPECSGFGVALSGFYLNTNRSAAALDFREAAQLDSFVCGTAPDYDMIGNSTVTMFANGKGAVRGGMCRTCPASGIDNNTLARTLPFGSCSVMALSAASHVLFEVNVNFTTPSYIEPEQLYVTSLDLGGTMKRSSNRYARGRLRAFSSTNPSAGKIRALAEDGYIAVCGTPQSSSVREAARTDSHGLKGVGAVPTANWFGHNFMWYWISPAEFQSYYGTGCGKIGSLGGIDQELYGSEIRLSAACAEVAMGENAVDGVCVPGNGFNPGLTPCQVASELNAFSDAWIAWRANDSFGPMPAIPDHLPPRYNPDAPNYHLTSYRGDTYLAITDNVTDSIPQVTFNLQIDVSEDLANYGGYQHNVLIDNNGTKCQYYDPEGEGALQVSICNRGNAAENYTVRVSGCDNVVSPFIFELGSTPLDASVSNVPNTLDMQCVTLNPFYYTLNDTSAVQARVNTSILSDKLSYPALIGECSIEVLNDNGTVLLGATSGSKTYTVDCFALETPTDFIRGTVFTHDPDPNSWWCVFTFACPEYALATYGVILAVVLVFIVIITACCVSKEKKKKEKETKRKQDAATRQQENTQKQKLLESEMREPTRPPVQYLPSVE